MDSSAGFREGFRAVAATKHVKEVKYDETPNAIVFALNFSLFFLFRVLLPRPPPRRTTEPVQSRCRGRYTGSGNC